MQLEVSDAARLLETSEAQIYAWIEAGSIPFYEVSEQYRFHRAELLEWATAQGRRVSVEIFHAYAGGSGDRATLSEALSAGGIHYGVPAHDSKSLTEALVARLPIADPAERALIRDVLTGSERFVVADGIAIPHVRNPIILHGARAAISLAFLERPVQEINTTFLVLTPNAKMHLLLLSQLSVALFDGGFKGAIARRATQEEIMREVRRIEVSINERRPSSAR